MAVSSDDKGAVWVGTTLGLCRLSGRTWTDYSMFNQKLKDQFINCIAVDGRGVLWIGTDDYGVFEFNGTHWTEHPKELQKYNMALIRDIAVDQDGVVWIGVTLSGLVRIDGKNWQKYTADQGGLKSDFIMDIAIDKDNAKWVATNEGVSKFDGSRWTSFTTANSKLPIGNVPAIAIDRKDVKWIGTIAGLCRFDDTDWQVFDTKNSPLPDNQINALCIDARGAIWMATQKGVAVFNGKDKWQVYNHKNSKLPNAAVRCMMIDQKGTKWFGTQGGGLVRFDGYGVKGRVVDEKGNPKANMVVNCGGRSSTTDADGLYYFELPPNSAGEITLATDATVEPPNYTFNNLNGFLFVKDFTVSSSLVAKGNSKEKVVVTPYLAEGYITISLESPTAEVEFVNAKGESVRTLPNYKNGAKITIAKMPKASYTLYIRTAKGEKSLQFNLK